MEESPEKLALSGAGDLRSMLNLSPMESQSPQKATTSTATDQPAETTRNAIKSLGGFGPVLQEYSLTSEFKLVQQQRFAGVYVTIAQQLVWDGIIFVRQGVYQGGIFRFKIHIPEDHPSNLAPTVYFDSVVFHPQIDALTGEVNIKKYFPTWYPDKSRLWHVVKVVDEMFTSADLVDPSHPAAAELYTADQATFEQRVSECIMLSKDDTKHAAASTISFGELAGKHKDRVINAMLEWGAEGALDRKRMRKLAEQQKQDPPSTLLNVRANIRKVHGAAVETARLKLADDGCRGWLSRLGDDSDWGRRWCVVGLPAVAAAAVDGAGPATQPGGSNAGSLRGSPEPSTAPSGACAGMVPFDPRFAVFSQYENEQEKALLDEAGIWDIVSAYQPPTAEMRANNTFMVVTTDKTVHQFRAASEKEVRVWLDVIRMRCAGNLKWCPGMTRVDL